MEHTLDQALQKGIEAHKAGQVQEADRLYTAILKAQPKHPDANHNMGVLAVGVGKVQEALPFFKTALEANPNTAQFWLSCIDALIKLDRMADAKALFDRATDNGAKGDGFDQLKLRLKEVEPTATIMSENQNLPKDQLQPLINLYTQGQLQKALDEAKRLLQKFPNSVVLCNISGASSQGLGRLDDALNSYKQALKIKPDYAEAINNIGNVLQEQGKSEEAVEAYTKALAIKPDNAEAYSNMGVALQEQGKLEEAIEAYKKALAIKPDNAEACNNMGAALKEQGKLEEAVEAFKKALNIKPGFSDAHQSMGDVLKDQGKLQQAIKFFKKSNTKSSIAKALECTYSLKKYGEFNKHLKAIATKDPNNIRVAAISAFAANQLQQEDRYPFCKNPIDLIKFSHIKNHISDPDQFIGCLMDEMIQKNAVWEPKNKTTKGGFQTSNQLFSSPSPNIKILEDIIKKELNLYKKKFNGNESFLFEKWPEQFKINAWYVRMLQSGHQDSHIHPGGWVSGVFYLKTVELPVQNEGAIEFGLQGYGYPVKNEDYPRRLYQPNNGDLVFFPSSLFHKTIPVIKDVERCVIAFDMQRIKKK